ncbi:hypothetical protein [Ammonifex degensii]|uniref:hypothetical protein n=1 Tax=Ammonifex degensii TaxID=42838 RepID=UPI001B7FA36B|nr:hypothetical protein [Ammonifex degensii]
MALKIFAAPEVLAATERKGVKPGTVFTEESCGTNALALAKEHQRLVAIRGEQHYCRLFENWWCVASPVRDPADRTVGYLDISLHAEKELRLAAAHLQTLVNLIEKELYLRELERKLRQAGVRLASSVSLSSDANCRQGEVYTTKGSRKTPLLGLDGTAVLCYTPVKGRHGILAQG